MRLKNIIANAFKGQTFTQPLLGVNVITGLNARGKSSRIEAAILALAGYVPGVAKKPNEIFERLATAGATSFGARVEMDNGWSIDRSFEIKRGSVKASALWNGFEKDYAIAPVAVDPNEYFALSDIERVKFVFRLATVSGLKTESVVKTLISNVKKIKLEQHTPLAEEEIDKLVDFISQRDQTETVQVFVEDLCADVKDLLKLANENAKRMTQTVQGLTQIKTAGDAPTDVESRMSKARQEFNGANTETSNALSELKTAKNQLSEAESQKLIVLGEEKFREQVAELEQQIIKLKLLPSGEVDLKPATEAQQKAAAEHSVNEKSCAAIEQEILRLRAVLAGYEKHTVCPTCGSDIAEKMAKLKAETNVQIHAQEIKLAEAEEKFNVTAEALNKAEGALADVHKVQRESIANLTLLNTANNKLAEMQRNLAGTAVAAAAVAKIPALTEAVTGAQTRYDVAAQTSIEKKKIVDDLDAEYRQLVTQRAEAKQRATAIEEANRKQTEVQVLDKFKDLLEALQAEVVEKAVKPILEQCNLLCGGILRLPLAFKDGEIGMQDVTGFVSQRTFSDSEKLLTYAALSIALAAESPLKLCIIGRFESFDVVNKMKVLSRLNELVTDGKLDQAIVVEVKSDADENPYSNYAKQRRDFLVINL